tara:strand:+ start:366 stop:632 length:267 start_codon:yes stop_codon:yes gene_type:complete
VTKYNVVLNLKKIFINMRKRMKQKYFASGEKTPQPLDIDLFKYECEEVLGMKELSDVDSYELAYFLIEHYYQIPTKDRDYLRYSVVEA